MKRSGLCNRSVCAGDNLDFHVTPQRSQHEREHIRETNLTVLQDSPSPFTIGGTGGIEVDNSFPG